MQTLNDAPAGRRRVAPLAPDDRRAALIEATLPLLCEHGMAVSTRQIADAAGVAEGTIFRVFPDKTSLIIATVLRGTDASDGVEGLADIDRGVDLRTRLTIATEKLAARFERRGRLHMVLRELMSDAQTAGAVAGHLHESRMRLLAALAEIMAPDAVMLRVSPQTAARIILTFIFAANGPLFDDNEALTGADIVAVLLDGLLRPEATTPAPTGTFPTATSNPAATSKESPC